MGEAMPIEPSQIHAWAHQVIDIEQAAIHALHDRINADFTEACRKILDCQGRVIVTGMGKSGHIGGKIAATLASTGTPAFFVHPGEASHGDLGMITSGDLVIALSNSGETHEILTILPLIKRMGASLISMTGQPTSTLAKTSDVHLHVGVEQEACPLDLAPTASTTAALVMGDALAITLLQARGFTPEDFALSHPGGNLGRRLLLRVSDLMHANERLPIVYEHNKVRDALIEITAKGLGMTAVLNRQNQLTGIFTDGDLRRCLDDQQDLHQVLVADVMTQGGVCIQANQLAAEALKLMQDKKINALLVLNPQDELAGALNMHDLLQAGVV